MAVERLPAVVPVGLIAERLQTIFPEGTAHRNYLVRAQAARTVFVMLYVGAIEGSGHWIRPSMVTDMTDVQAAMTDDAVRLDWYRSMLSPRKSRAVEAWYAVNSREQVRDETLRLGLVPTGAVVERPGLAVTSSLPRYALAVDFTRLFDSALDAAAFDAAVAEWQAAHLSAAARARLHILRSGRGGGDALLVRYPDGTSERLVPGPSSIIAKAVIEEFAPRFLGRPAVLWLSDSASKVRAADQALARALGLDIDPAKVLPDIILVDLEAGTQALFVFVEVVASEGPVNEHRRNELLRLAAAAGFGADRIAFLTAYEHRGAGAYARTVGQLAVPSFAWCRSEPEHLFILRDRPGHLPKLM